jgi:hypothetical protein
MCIAYSSVLSEHSEKSMGTRITLYKEPRSSRGFRALSWFLVDCSEAGVEGTWFITFKILTESGAYVKAWSAF